MAVSRALAQSFPDISRPSFVRAFSTTSSFQAGQSNSKTSSKSSVRSVAKSPPRNSSKVAAKRLPLLEFRNASRPRIIKKENANQRSRLDAASDLIRKGAENPDVNLLAPVHSADDPEGVLKPDHPAASILQNSSIIVQRQLEAMNVLVGFEQANRYVLLDPQGNHIGYLAEHDGGIGNQFSRQTLRTHRAFTAHVFDKQEREVLRIHRPFSWINSTIGVYESYSALSSQPSPEQVSKNWAVASSMPLIGATQQQWAPLRRKYQMFTRVPRDGAQVTTPGSPMLNLPDDLQFSDQKTHALCRFAYVDEEPFSWDFTLRGNNGIVGSVNRAWRGAAREILTDTGVYALRMDSVALSQEEIFAKANGADVQASPRGMTLDERAVMLSTAVTIDFDYFSRHSSALGGIVPIPIWIPGIGGEAVAGGAGVGLGEVGATEGLGAAGAAGAFSAYHHAQKPNEPDWGKEDPWDKGNGGGGASGGDSGSGDGGDGFDIGDFF
ncbi:Scramblase-domain-containing protein [Phyllosticta capitalensis]|uniref:Scramblase-domain-containing protein n=1 Tax=Phyllosticta capitalensis TaxID=121624 RepID=UPI00312DBF42